MFESKYGLLGYMFIMCKNVWELNNLYWNLGISLILDLFVYNKIWV